MQDIPRLRPIWLVALLALCGSVNAQIHLASDGNRRAALEEEARIERMVMVPMRMAFDWLQEFTFLRI